MPKELEDKLRREANEHKGWSKKHKAAYIYGTLAEIKKAKDGKW